MSNTKCLDLENSINAKNLTTGTISVSNDKTSKIYIDNNPWTISSSIDSTALDYETIFKEMAKRFNKIPIIQHKCHNCGGTVEMDENKHIFKCPYCKSCYAVGTSLINCKI